ncbi:MAG: four helix bundle protein [Vicingaceae bacterium]
MRKNIIKEKSLDFALEIVDLCKRLKENKEFILADQAMRSGTAIGALVREVEYAESGADFIHKLSIALKEAYETDYWLELIHRGEHISVKEKESYQLQNTELIKLLVSIIKKRKQNINYKKK